jgi:CBS domain containing-hemolysin-like protein
VGKLVGAVSRKDLLKALTSGDDAAKETAKSIMTEKPQTVTWTETVETAANLMIPTRASRLMVVDDEDNLLGIITASDIISVGFMNELSEVIYEDEASTPEDYGSAITSQMESRDWVMPKSVGPDDMDRPDFASGDFVY